jgi:hypothetical protein
MRQLKPQGRSNVDGERVTQVVAAFAAFRRVHGPRRRIPLALRKQFVAALDAGVSASALGKACGVSWTQTRYWKSTAKGAAPMTAAPQVLSVVDRQTTPAASSSADKGIELRVGCWRISLSRSAD